MIHWLIQTATAHPDLLRGVPPPDLLSAEETAVFSSLEIAKRRQDWLLGRWTAKQLLHEVIRQQSGQTVPLDAMSILAGEDGAPAVHFGSQFAMHNAQFTISISHSHDTAYCAAVQRPDWPLGADLEWIESRSPRFAADYCTDKEQAFLTQVPPKLRDLQVTALWSAKEAALKAVRQGLRFDTRYVECRFELVEKAPQEWVPFHICWRHRSEDMPLPQLQGWWMAADHYVLTLAVEEGREKNYVA